MTAPYSTLAEFYALLKPEAIVNSARRITGVDPAANRFRSPGHALVSGDVLRFELGDAAFGGTPAIPSPLSEFALYYALPAGSDLFAVSASAGGSAIDITDAGAGLLSFVVDMEATILGAIARQGARIDACLTRRGVDVSLLVGTYPDLAQMEIQLAAWPTLLARGYTAGRTSNPDQDYKLLWQSAEEWLADLCSGKSALPAGLPGGISGGLAAGAAWDISRRGWTPGEEPLNERDGL